MTKKHRFNLHIPIDLWQDIKKLASQHRRSITQEILLAIEKHVRDYKDGDDATS